MTNPITKVNVYQQVAPVPSQFQKQGAAISQGATDLTPGTCAIIQQPSDLTSLLQAPVDILSLTSTGLVATATLEGVASDVVSGTYNSTTGLVTLTLNESLDLVEGDAVYVPTLTGTGDFAGAEGTWTCAADTTGDTITYFVAPGLSMTITGGTAQATPGLPNGAQFVTTIAGAQPSGYNGTYLATVTGPTQFTFPLAASLTSPATGTPTYTPGNQGEVGLMVQTFFAQGTGQAMYVLELGAGTPAEGIAALAAFLVANPNTQPNQPNQLPNSFYSYLVPRSWDGQSTFLTLIGLYQFTTSKLYFFVTTTLANWNLYTGDKNVVALVEAPGVQATEFSIAAPWRVTLNYKPSSTNRVTPLNLAFVFGVTPYPTNGNASLLSTLDNANVNVIANGAQGGQSNLMLIGGNNMDGNPFNYWYSVDWAQITSQQAIDAALANGSNNPANPIYYDQDGINALLQVIVSTFNNGIQYGLVLNPVKQTALDAEDFIDALDNETYAGFTQINADPFTDYVTENPDDFPAGLYTGFSASYVPLRGFASIVFNITVSNFATG